MNVGRGGTGKQLLSSSELNRQLLPPPLMLSRQSSYITVQLIIAKLGRLFVRRLGSSLRMMSTAAVTVETKTQHRTDQHQLV